MKPDPHSIFSILEVCARADVNLVKRSILMELARMASLDGQLSSFASQKRIAFFLGMTDRTVRTHLKELEDMGLIRRTRRSNDYGHRKTDVVYLVWDELLKVSKSLPENTSTRQSLPENDDTLPETGRKPSGKLLPVIKNSPDINSPDKNYPDTPPTPQGGLCRFEEFWAVYPRKVQKKAALKNWKKMKLNENADEVIAGAKRYAEYISRQKTDKIKYPQGWLTDERWNDELPTGDPLPETAAGKARHQMKSVTDQLIEEAMNNEPELIKDAFGRVIQNPRRQEFLPPQTKGLLQ